MKKTVLPAVLVLLVSTLLCGCFSVIMTSPDEGSIGSPKQFEKDGIKLTLTDKFEEQQSERGFDAYYVSDFCGVVILKEEFDLEEGLSEMTPQAYITNVIANNGHTGITPRNEDGLWFYENTTESRFVRSYCFKGTDAFCTVQFVCNLTDKSALEDMFYLWAQTVEMK